MTKNTFFVIVEQDKTTGKTCAYVRTIPNYCNLKDIFDPGIGCSILSINAYSTKKKAKEIANLLNFWAREKNNYMFQNTP